MRKEDFIDHAFLALVSQGQAADTREEIDALWTHAEMLYHTRPKTKSIKEERAKIARFVKPSPEEAQAYIDGQGYVGFTGESFVAFYDSKGWKVGNTGMKDWKAAIRQWWTRYKEKNPHAAAQATGQKQQAKRRRL